VGKSRTAVQVALVGAQVTGTCCTKVQLGVELAAATVSSAAKLATLPAVAVMYVLPAATPIAKPPAPMVASAGTEEVQVTLEVRFCMVTLL